MSRRYWKSEENTRPVARLNFLGGAAGADLGGQGARPLPQKRKEQKEREREKQRKSGEMQGVDLSQHPRCYFNTSVFAV